MQTLRNWARYSGSVRAKCARANTTPSAPSAPADRSSHSSWVRSPAASCGANETLEIATFIRECGFLKGVPRTSPLSVPDRQTLAGIVPLAAVCIALAEYLLDHTEPRWTSPWFWAGLIATVGLLIFVQVLRFMKSSPARPSKPDYSATSIIRRKSSLDEGKP